MAMSQNSRLRTASRGETERSSSRSTKPRSRSLSVNGSPSGRSPSDSEELDRTRAMTVDEPADQDRVEGAEHGRERKSPRRSRARPAEFGGQRPEEHAEGVEDGADVQAVRDEADRDDPPAVKDARR